MSHPMVQGNVGNLMTWNIFVEDNEATFRREFGIINPGTGEKEVFAWISYEALYGPGGEDLRESRTFFDWCLRAAERCALEADWKNRLNT